MDIMTLNLRSVAMRERNIGHPELAGIIDSAADRIDDLTATIEQLGAVSDTCTYDILRKVCEGCRCKRRVVDGQYPQAESKKP